MYTVAVKRDFIAQHYLVGGDWGAENQCHSHHYQVELILEAAVLDQNGFLVDIVEIEQALDAQVSRYRDQVLNEQPEFTGLNPSIEQFAHILCQAFVAQIQATNLCSVTVKLWENKIAWAAYRQEL